MIETIKEYLVSLGFAVDKGSFDKANKATTEIGKGVKQMALDIAANFGKASVAVGGFVAAAVAGTSKFLEGLGNQEIQTEMLARQLWTTQQQAQAFSFTLKALGATLQDLYLSPTLMNQYKELNAVAQEMQTPGDYNQVVGMAQSVSLQFKQMKLEASYAFQWIGYYLIKDLAGPMGSVQKTLQSLNTAIVKNMPTWTKHVADVIASFMQAGTHIRDALDSILNGMRYILSFAPTWAKGVAAALAALGIALSMNPFGLFVAAIGGAILMVDDFETYIHGGKAALAPFWAWLIKTADGFKQLNGASNVGKNIQTTFQNLGKVFQNVGIWFQNMVNKITRDGTLTGYIKSQQDVMQSWVKMINSIISALGNMFGAMTNNKNKSAAQNFGAMMTDVMETVIKMVGAANEELSSLFQLVSDLVSGKWKAALGDLADITTMQNIANWANATNTHAPPIGPVYYPSAYGPSTSTTHNTYGSPNVTITQNIQGTNPQATANAANNGINNVLMRNFRSPMQ